MKKVFNITTITVIILILAIVILFCSKINKISIIENIKQKIAKTEEIQTENEVTTIDVTDLEDNGNLEHEHIFKTMYDENKHWEECTICGKKENDVNHIYTDNWNLGYESCLYYNYCNKVCKCGYSYIWHKPCVWNGKSYILNIDAYQHCKACSVCGDHIKHSYYWGTTLYQDGGLVNCRDSNNSSINCANLKRCTKCNYNYTRSAHAIYPNEENILYCYFCRKEFGRYTQEITKDSNTPTTYTIIDKVILTNGATFDSLMHILPTSLSVKNLSLLEYSSTQFTMKSVVKSTSDRGFTTSSYFWVRINGIRSQASTHASTLLYEDCIKPTISNITTQSEEELTQWSKTKPIVINGTENYCQVVKVKIEDDEQNKVFEGEANVKNNNYSITCIPELECGINGRTFLLTVTDSCNNSITQEFTIAKIDKIPPRPTSGTEILGDWAKSKDFTFTATDYGIGQVSIAFNDMEDLQLAKVNENTYLRDYRFTGDVYQPKQLSVMYKDGLGNTSIQKITIDKIDNTAPSITNAELHNNKIKVTSHDEHETLEEGSGVAKYRYLASEEKLENPTLTTENSIEVNKTEEIKIKDIYKMKYIYVIAEDYVGNTSEVYEFKVPELKLTAIANLNTANGKGEIILDWSSYDVADKYFVIYRKKENQEEWDTIVRLEQKLTGSRYTDILANDETKPNTPSITIKGDTENNNINVTANSSDNGTQYNYYIEAYDSTGELLSKSN